MHQRARTRADKQTNKRGKKTRHNSTPWSPEPCLAGWPHAPCSRAFRVFWIALGGYYAHELLATLLRVTSGVQKRDMLVHHSATLVLNAFAYAWGIHRSGLMMVCLYETSTPLLCAAKAMHASRLPALRRAKGAAFNAFAAVFFVGRVMALSV